ncbi:MAG TPA: DMT family transporter, partial [Anaerolineales bacterium]|nr:DMT family transporter [Anaerolineales bacterium]
RRLTGIILIAISAASFGTLAIFGRYAYAENIDTFTLLFLRFGFSASFMTMMLILRKEPFPRGRVLAQLIGMGGIGYAGQSFLYLTAIKYASAGLVALLLYLYPFFVAILSMIFLQEKLTRVKAFALALALCGTALTVGPVSGQPIGAIMAIVAALGYSIYIIVGANVMKHVSPFQSSTVIFASASVVYGLLTFTNGIHLPQTNFGWLVIAGIVVVSTIIPVTTFLAGLERIGPTNAAMLSTIEPIITVFLATVLFGDKLAPIVLAGGALILIAVVILTRSEMRSIET